MEGQAAQSILVTAKVTVLSPANAADDAMAMSATAHAGSTITDKSYWPSEARQNAKSRTAGSQSDLNSALAYDRAALPSQPAIVTNDRGSFPRNQGGPKSRCCSHGVTERRCRNSRAVGRRLLTQAEAQRVADKHRPPQPFHVLSETSRSRYRNPLRNETNEASYNERYAVEAGIIETNPAHGIRKPKDRVRSRRLFTPAFRKVVFCVGSDGSILSANCSIHSTARSTSGRIV
jgi:hypothetical protein